MTLITRALDRMRGKPDGALAATPFSDLLIIYSGMPLNAGRLRFYLTSKHPRKLALPCKRQKRHRWGFDPGIEVLSV
jgi:hypothetical protein